MTAGSGIAVIAATGASHSLQFYWQALGAATWNPEQVAGAATTYSAPSMTITSGDLFIAAVGPGRGLRFYWQVLGTAGWNPEQVAGAGTTYSAPSLTTDSASATVSAAVIVSAAGPGGSLDFYWQVFGTATWNPEQVAPPGSVG